MGDERWEMGGEYNKQVINLWLFNGMRVKRWEPNKWLNYSFACSKMSTDNI
jgi:hypothetical protein